MYGNAGDHSTYALAYDVCGSPAGRSITVPFKCLGGGITPMGPCDAKLVLCNPASASVTDDFRASLPQPNGTTYHWDVDQGADKAPCISGCNTEQATFRGTAASGAPNDVRIRLRYTNGGLTCYAYFNTTVQKPTSLQ